MKAKVLRISRNEYIKKFIKNMDKELYDQERKIKLTKISKRVRKESTIINSEFSRIET